MDELNRSSVIVYIATDIKKQIYNIIRKVTVTNYSQLVFSEELYRVLGQNKFAELIHGRASILPSPYILKYAQFP